MSPAEAREPKNHALVYKTQFPESDMEQIEPSFPKFLSGDQVRVSMKKEIFDKEAQTGWSEEVFVVDKYVPGNPSVYTLKDLAGEKYEGTFYPQQLLHTDQKIFRINKVQRRRIGANGKKEAYVSWHGYKPSFSQWIDQSDIEEREK